MYQEIKTHKIKILVIEEETERVMFFRETSMPENAIGFLQRLKEFNCCEFCMSITDNLNACCADAAFERQQEIEEAVVTGN